MKLLITLVMSALISFNTEAQSAKKITYVKQIWAAYINQSRFSNHWGSWFAFHLRTKEKFVTDFSQFMIQGGLSYYFTNNTRLTVGYTYAYYFPADGHPNIYQPEHRPWQNFQWNTNFSRVKLSQAVRLEERFRRKIASPYELDHGYNFNYRAGYTYQVSIALSRKGFTAHTLSLVLNDDLQLNFGKEIVYNYFDQNRIMVALNYETTKHNNIQVGYLNQFQQLASGSSYRDLHVLRVYYFHSVNFRKKKISNEVKKPHYGIE